MRLILIPDSNISKGWVEAFSKSSEKELRDYLQMENDYFLLSGENGFNEEHVVLEMVKAKLI